MRELASKDGKQPGEQQKSWSRLNIFPPLPVGRGLTGGPTYKPLSTGPGLSLRPQPPAAPLPQPAPQAFSVLQALPALMRTPAGALTVNDPNDAFEEEADRVADQVMRMPDPVKVQRTCSCSDEDRRLQRTCASCKEKEEEERNKIQAQVQRSASAPGPATVPPIVHEVLRSPGQPLDARTRSVMEPRFGQSFGHVRVHADAKAAESAHAVDALAYTVGSDIVFGSGQYAPKTDAGTRLLAHELTHTIQQGNGNTPFNGNVDQSYPVSEPRAGATLAIESRPSLQRKEGGVISSTLGAIGRGAENVLQQGEDFIIRQIERLAPGVLALLRDAGSFLFDKMVSGLESLFSELSSRIQKQGVAGGIASFLTDIATTISKSLVQLGKQSCNSAINAASSVIGFVSGLAGSAFHELAKIVASLGHFFSDVWDRVGAPALDFVKKVAGGAWDWIQQKAQWLWDKLEPVRRLVSSAWNWIKRKFNIVKDGAIGFLEWLSEKAKEQWLKVRDRIAPLLTPLKIVAGTLVLLSPLGPVLAVWKGAPWLWKGLKWLWEHAIQPFTELARTELREHVLPWILSGVATANALLDKASGFLCSHLGTITSNLQSLEQALNGIPFLKFAAAPVGLLRGFLGNLSDKGSCRFSDIVAEAKSLLHGVGRFLHPVLEALRQAALIALTGPFAILDDGVWKSLNKFVGLIKKTPCLREIAGFVHVDAVMSKVGNVRAAIKDIWQVVSNSDKFEAAIAKALDGMLQRIPAQVETIAGAVLGLDRQHTDTLLRRFVAPKLASLVGHWKQLAIDTLWDQLWPWPGVKKDVAEIEVQAGKLKSALWDFSFSGATDAGLAIWRSVNGIGGHLFGWFFLASVLIGTVFASPEAGLDIAAKAGEALLMSTIAAETLSMAKASANLMAETRLRETEAERAKADDADYETLSGSAVNLAVLGVMTILGGLAVDFGRLIFAEIKGIFLPRQELSPIDAVTASPKEAIRSERVNSTSPKLEQTLGAESPEVASSKPRELSAPENGENAAGEEQKTGRRAEERVPEEFVLECFAGSLVCPKGIPKKIREQVGDYPHPDRVPEPKGEMRLRGKNDPEYEALRSISTTDLRKLVLENPRFWSKEFKAAYEVAQKVARKQGREFNPLEEDWPRDNNGKAWEVHHLKPLDFGGSNIPMNLTAIEKAIHTDLTTWWRRIKTTIGKYFKEDQWNKLIGGDKKEIFDPSENQKR